MLKIAGILGPLFDAWNHRHNFLGQRQEEKGHDANGQEIGEIDAKLAHGSSPIKYGFDVCAHGEPC